MGNFYEFLALGRNAENIQKPSRIGTVIKKRSKKLRKQHKEPKLWVVHLSGYGFSPIRLGESCDVKQQMGDGSNFKGPMCLVIFNFERSISRMQMNCQLYQAT
jgi:hypothetical protein